MLNMWRVNESIILLFGLVFGVVIEQLSVINIIVDMIRSGNSLMKVKNAFEGLISF